MAKPRFLFDNRLSDATPVASSTAAGEFNVLNLLDWRPFTWWKPASLPATVTTDCGSAKAADYALLYAEASTYEVRASTDNFAASDVLVATVTVAEAGLKLAVFNSASYRYWRLRIPSGPAPAVAIAAIGAALEAPVYLEDEVSPIDREVHGETNRNENGHALGRSISFESWRSQVVLKNVSWTWARATFLPAWKSHLRGKPFGWVWDADTYPEDVRLVAAGDRVSAPHRKGALCTVSIDLEGVAP